MPPVDIDAIVLSNVRLSRDYSVLSVAAPDIGDRTQPGQFVMVKPGRSTDPLLRRPFSVFEVLRDGRGAVSGISLLNKRAGRSTGMLYDLEAGDRLSCLGPLGRPFAPVMPPTEAWMVAGGVGLAPFATLAVSLAATRTPTTLFYGARSGDELFYLDFFDRLGVRQVISTEDGSRGRKGRVTAPLEDALRAIRPDGATDGATEVAPYVASVGRDAVGRDAVGRDSVGRDAVGRDAVGRDFSPADHSPADHSASVGRDFSPADHSAVMVYACGPEPMLAAVAGLAARYHQPSQVSVERVMGCGLGGCYSCVVPVRHADGRTRLVRSCLSGPVFDGADLVWDEGRR